MSKSEVEFGEDTKVSVMRHLSNVDLGGAAARMSAAAQGKPPYFLSSSTVVGPLADKE